MKDVQYSLTLHLDVPYVACDRGLLGVWRHAQRLGPGEFSQRTALGLGTWTEDTVSFRDSRGGSDVTYSRKWHAPVVGRVLGPVMKLTWRGSFRAWHQHLGSSLGGERQLA